MARFIISLAIWTALIWALFSFVAWHLSVSDWSADGRLGALILWVAGAIAIFRATLGPYSDKDDYL